VWREEQGETETGETHCQCGAALRVIHIGWDYARQS
jgi:hypothetical protein